MNNNKRLIPEHGLWTAALDSDGRLVLSSDDFHHDAMMRVSGDFADAATRLTYGEFLCRVLNAGCNRARARQELDDPGQLVQRLEQAVAGPQGELLQEAASEVARLRVALAEADETLRQLSAHRYFQRKTEQALQPSAFAVALQAALVVKGSSQG